MSSFFLREFCLALGTGFVPVISWSRTTCVPLDLELDFVLLIRPDLLFLLFIYFYYLFVPVSED